MSLITSVIGGIMGGNAAGNAANAQVGGLQQAANTVTSSAAAGNELIAGASTNGQAQVLQAGQDAGNGATTTAATGANNVNAAALAAAGGVSDATTKANALLDPYASAGKDAIGTLQAGLVPGGDFNKTPTLADLQIDPGYAFRLQQGQLALERSAAARGGTGNGGEMKDLTNFAQGAASQEYQNAFSRFETSTQNRYANLAGVANGGLVASTTQGNNTIGSAKYGGDVNNAAAMFGAGLNENASQYAGTAGIGTNEYAANLGYNSATTQAQNSNVAATYAGNTQIQAGNARAGGILGKQQSYNNMLTGIGGFANSALGYFSPTAYGVVNGLKGPS